MQEVEAHSFGTGAEDLFRGFCGKSGDLDGKGWVKLCRDPRRALAGEWAPGRCGAVRPKLSRAATIALGTKPPCG